MPKSRKIKHYSLGYMNRRRRRGKFLKALLFLLILAVLIFLGYCVAKSIENLRNRPESSDTEDSLPAVSAVISESSMESSAESVSSQIETTESQGVQAVFLPQDALADMDALETFLDSLDQEQYSTVAIQLKNESGYLSYASEVPLAASCGAITSSAVSLEQLAETVAAIENAGFTPAAYLYTLQDDVASHASYGTSYLYNDQAGITWLDQAADNGGRSWLNPYMDAAVDYLAGLTGEIAEAGFSLIFADGMQFPITRYPAEMGFGPNQDSMTQTEALQNVLDTMQAEAAKGGAEVVPVFAGECYLGENESYYGGSPDAIETELAAPVLAAGRETEILNAVLLDKENLIPVISSAEQIPVLEAAGITQYLIKE